MAAEFSERDHVHLRGLKISRCSYMELTNFQVSEHAINLITDDTGHIKVDCTVCDYTWEGDEI